MNTYNLVKSLLYIREVEEQISKRYSEGEMRCPVHLSVGQEATAVGVISNLKKNDHVYSSHRSHAHYLSKNGSLHKMLAEIYGKETGCIGGRGGSMHLQDLQVNFDASIPIVSSSIGLAAGCALNMKRNKQKKITVVFIGDAALEEGIFFEVANFSSLHSLPILFVCENNYYSVYTKISDRQVNKDLTSYAKSFKIKSKSLDGNDVFKIFNETKKIVSSIRKKPKPFFLQLNTFRHLEHCGPNNDDHLKYRSNKDIKLWKKNDPIEKAIKVFEKSYGKIELSRLQKKIKSMVEKNFVIAKNDPLPKNSEARKFVYV
jgi:TPP-dependent pyruvate/acetoin dehydrogenase alpha subunit